MCGVVGFVGEENSVPILINGLSRLEYRGYDSAGIAVFNGEKIQVLKALGRLKNLETKLDNNKISGKLGIGHTRWATHGAPSDVNSHPHFNFDMKIAVVHNGIIENFMEIKEELIDLGYSFKSDTDTETVAHLLDFYYKKNSDILESIYQVLDKITGSYALGILCDDYPDTLFAARKESPLIIGIGEGANYIASDMPAILNYTRKIIFLDESEVAVIKKDSINIFDKNKNKQEKEVVQIDWDLSSAEKDGYDHFMLKEIFEQPKVIKDTISGRVLEDKINLDDLNLTKEDFKNINKIYIVACGTAFYAGLFGKFLIESTSRLDVRAEFASEFRYNNPIIDEKTLVILVSQSGETADTIAALKLAKSKNCKTLAICNVVGSTISREVDNVFYTVAGPEISVASTKAFTSQLISFYILSTYICQLLNKITDEEYKIIKQNLEQLPSLVDNILIANNKVEKFTQMFLNSKNVFYIGRGLDYVMTMEGSLKLKEIAYLHSESYAAGELKHGPLALIGESTLVIGVLTQENILDKTISNLRECKARGAKILAIAMYGNEEIEKFADHVFYIPRTNSQLAPILANIFQQLFAYHMAVGLENDVDKPRNLAKSVTVE